MPETFQLKKPIGPNHVVDPGDTVRTKAALAGLGFLEPPEEGITPWPDRPMIDAVTDFQRANGLKPDGVINRGGPTEEAINVALATGSDVGVIPGMEPTKPKIGVEAFDPALGGRGYTHVDASIETGPLFRIPNPEGRRVDGAARRGRLSEQAHATLAAGGGHLGIPPGMEPTKPRVGVEPALGGREHTHVDAGIETGPLFRIPDEPPKAGADAKEPSWEDRFRKRLNRNFKDLFEWSGNTKGKVVIDRPEGGWLLGWLFDDPKPLILAPEAARLIVDMGEYSDRDQGLSLEEERELHRRASTVLKGNRTAFLEFHKRIGDLRDGPISDSEFDSLMRVASEEWFWQDGSFNSGIQSGMLLEWGR